MERLWPLDGNRRIMIAQKPNLRRFLILYIFSLSSTVALPTATSPFFLSKPLRGG
jgi:hypothetical protein